MLSIIKLLVELGLQSLRAHRTKSLIVGGLMAFGAFVVVASLALLDSVERGSRQSIVESISGDLQVFDKDAKDKLALFGGFGFGTEDIGEVKSYADTRAGLMKIDNVRGVVPMGIANASVSAPGDLDRTLNDVRKAVRDGDLDGARALGERVRAIADILKDQVAKQAAISSTVHDSSKDVLARATSDELWADFNKDPLPVLDWLDTQLAPLGEQGNQFFLRLVGTDLTDFSSTFGRLKIVEGTMVPPNTRGVLVGKSFLDRRIKLGVAMNLDTLLKEHNRGSFIKTTTTLQEMVARTQRQSTRVQYLLSPKDTVIVEDALLKLLPDHKKGDLATTLKDFFAITDDNVVERVKFFYDVIGPRVQLYPFKVGDTITMTAFTKSGYLRSVNVKVYGIYSIEGLEGSDIAGSLSLTDLVTFRDLYGQRTAALDDELKKMKATSGAAAVNREDAEAALFGGGDVNVDAKAVTAHSDGELDKPLDKVERTETLTFDQEQENKGFVLSIAVLLKDPSRARSTLKDVTAAMEPMGLQVVDWQQATGIVGQITMVVRAVLLAAIFILFLVTVVILNNSLVMATLERVAEFGTLRAIGAQRGFVNAMVVFETAVLGAIAGTGGALLGVLLISWLGHTGIPAPTDLLQVIFGGPRLYPTVSVGNVVAGLVATFLVSVLATLYPARLATRVQPVVAMQGKE